MALDRIPPSLAAHPRRALRLVIALGLAQLGLLFSSPFVMAEAEHVTVPTALVALAPTLGVCALAILGALWAGYYLLSGRTIPDWSLAAPMVLPILAATLVFRMRLPRFGETSSSEAVTRSVSSALEALGTAAFGGALVLGTASMFLAMRAGLGAKPMRIDRTTVVALVTAGAGSVALAMSLGGSTALFVVAPIVFGVIALGVSGSALAGPAVERPMPPDPNVALDGLAACVLSLGAVMLGACAYGATRIAQHFSDALAGLDRVSLLETGWARGITEIRRASLCIPLFAVAGLIVFSSRARALGLGFKLRLSDFAIVSAAILASVALLRTEVTRGGRAVARGWSTPDVAGIALPEVRAFGSIATSAATQGLVVGRTQVRQKDRVLGEAKQLDSVESCRALAEKVEAPANGVLTIAIDAATTYSRLTCLALGLASKKSAPQCKLAWLAVPESVAPPFTLPPLQNLRPEVVVVETSSAGLGSCEKARTKSLELAEATWTHERADGSYEERTGGVKELEAWAHGALANTSVALGAMAELPADRVLAIAGVIVSDKGQVVLVPPEGQAAAVTPAPPAPKKQRVRLGKPTSSGVADLPKITGVVSSRRAKLEACYEEALSRVPALAGPLVVRFSLQQDGNVSNAMSGSANFADKTCADCMIEVFKNTSYPPPLGGGATIFYPLTLEPAGFDAEDVPAEATGVSFDIEKVTVSGMLVPAEVQSRIDKLRPTVEKCAARASGVALDGVLSVRFTIGPGGGVTNVIADTESKIPSGVAGCIYSALYQIGFPTPSEASVTVTAPIRFHPATP